MLRNHQILVSALVLAGSAATLSGCGQSGPLFLPTEPAAAHRASLPQSLLPGSGDSTTTALPPSRPSSTPSTPR